MLGIDLLAVPAAAYFLWVVHALYRGTFRDWNGAPSLTRNTVGPTPPPGHDDGPQDGMRPVPVDASTSAVP